MDRAVECAITQLASLYQFRYTPLMKKLQFLGDSRARLAGFPEDARKEAGFQLWEVQCGRDPRDWKPMQTVGQGVREIRIRDASGAYRVIYLSRFEDDVIVLHCFEKKTQTTPLKDIELAKNRLWAWKT